MTPRPLHLLLASSLFAVTAAGALALGHRLRPHGSDRARTPVPKIRVTGHAPKLLYPGAAPRRIPVALTNAGTRPVRVIRLRVRLRVPAPRAACRASQFVLATRPLPRRGVLVPPRSTVALPVASDPTLRMVESGRNQDRCQGMPLRLSYRAYRR